MVAVRDRPERLPPLDAGSGRDPIPVAAADELVSEPDGDELEGALDAALAHLPRRRATCSSATTWTGRRMPRSRRASASRRTPCRCASAAAAPSWPASWRRSRRTGGATPASGARAAGSTKLQMLRTADCVAFRCANCAPVTSAAYDLGNPAFAHLVDELVRPAAILRRAAAWSSGYFGGGAHHADCLRCARPVRLRHERSESRRGLLAECGACGHAVWSSVRGLAQGLPESRAFPSSTAASARSPSATSAIATPTRRSSGWRPFAAAPRSTSCSRGTRSASSPSTDRVTRALGPPPTRLRAALDRRSRFRRRRLGPQRRAALLRLRASRLDGRDRRDDRRCARTLRPARLGRRCLRRSLGPQARPGLGQPAAGGGRLAAPARARSGWLWLVFAVAAAQSVLAAFSSAGGVRAAAHPRPDERSSSPRTRSTR